jgi:NADPH-dependent glutamate synthase beta subunit-like oxidoreductase
VPTANNLEVGIVGGGPSSVACAIGLGQRGIKTHIFEKEREAGGLPAWAIPEDRLPVDVVQRDLYSLASYPIKIHAGQEITSLKELREKYDAIYVGVGALKEGSLDITGLDGPDVYNGLEFLRTAKQNPDKIVMRGPVRIIGGGNVAVDCALVSSALGANRISVIYRRSRTELPAWDREVNEAFNRGVDFLFQLQPLAIERQGELIYRLICRRTTLGSPGEDGRRVPILLTSESISLETGMVIIAAGQSTITFDDESLDANDRGNIIIDEANRTSLNGVYAGGDATGKCGTVVEAVKSGLNTAFSIAKDLENR